jgi:hypothetical protein
MAVNGCSLLPVDAVNDGDEEGDMEEGAVPLMRPHFHFAFAFWRPSSE